LTKYLTHPWLTIRVQLALGAIFIIAALPKIADPPSFAHMIYNYRILPAGLINISSLVMPWVELLCGIALVLGVWRRPALAIVTILLVLFVAAISFNLARGNASRLRLLQCQPRQPHNRATPRRHAARHPPRLRDVVDGWSTLVGHAPREHVGPALQPAQAD